MSVDSPESFHQKNNFYFHTLIALPLAAFVYLFLEIKHKSLEPIMSDSTITTVILIFAVILSIVISYLAWRTFKKSIEKSRQQPILKSKLEDYLQHCLRLYLLTGAAAVIMVVGLYLTTSAIFIVLYVFLLFYLSLNRPTPQKYIHDLRLNGIQKDIVFHNGQFEQDTSV